MPSPSYTRLATLLLVPVAQGPSASTSETTRIPAQGQLEIIVDSPDNADDLLLGPLLRVSNELGKHFVYISYALPPKNHNHDDKRAKEIAVRAAAGK